MPTLNIRFGIDASEEATEAQKNKLVLIVKEITTTVVLGIAAVTAFRIIESALTKRLS